MRDPFINILILEHFEYKQNLDDINLLWHAIMRMDILEIYNLLRDEYNYFSLTKNGFTELLDTKLKKHQFLGDDEFYLTLNECRKCHKNEIICEFVGFTSGIGLSIYFEIKNSELIGLQFCDAYGKIEDLDHHYDWNAI